MQDRIITLIGGTGFVGRYVTRTLAKAGYRIRIVARRPQAALPLKTAGNLGQIALLHGDLSKPETIIPYIQDAYAVVDLVGVLFESSRQRFTTLHAKGAERLAQAAKAAGVTSFVYLSALGVDRASSSSYARSKALGEKAVLAAFPDATILRPSVIFGPEDHFFNRFAQMSTRSPALPLIGGGDTRFQPVYVGDVAEAVKICIENHATAGKTFELGGPDVLTFRQVMERVLQYTGHKRLLAPLPFALGSAMATVMECIPGKPLTRDQVRLLHYDNVVSPDALNFAALGLHPTAIDLVVPDYLAVFRAKHPLIVDPGQDPAL